MLRVTMFSILSSILFGCHATESDVTTNKDNDISSISFGETVRFPVELALTVEPFADPSCIMVQKIVPIYSGDEFLSFRHQNCATKSISVVADQGNVEIIWEHELPLGEPMLMTYPPFIIEKGNMKSPEDYLDNLYSTNDERRYCKPSEKAPSIWEINNIGYSRIPNPPPMSDLLADWEPPNGLSKTEEDKLRAYKSAKKHADYYRQFNDQEKINRVCERLPIAAYLFFEDEYVLTVPKYIAPVLDVTSIQYHKK